MQQKKSHSLKFYTPKSAISYEKRVVTNGYTQKKINICIHVAFYIIGMIKQVDI